MLASVQKGKHFTPILACQRVIAEHIKQIQKLFLRGTIVISRVFLHKYKQLIHTGFDITCSCAMDRILIASLAIVLIVRKCCFQSIQTITVGNCFA